MTGSLDDDDDDADDADDEIVVLPRARSSTHDTVESGDDGWMTPGVFLGKVRIADLTWTAISLVWFFEGSIVQLEHPFPRMNA